MIDKERLLQLRGVSRELILLKKELSELEILERASDALYGAADARLDTLRTKIAKRTAELTAKYESFNDLISSVEDPFDRSALMLRYFYGMTWQKVAFSLGEYDEQYARRRCEKYYS